jgi:hypothetical protein
MAFHFMYKHRPVQASGAPAPVIPQCVVSSFFFPYIDDESKQRCARTRAAGSWHPETRRTLLMISFIIILSCHKPPPRHS